MEDRKESGLPGRTWEESRKTESQLVPELVVRPQLLLDVPLLHKDSAVSENDRYFVLGFIKERFPVERKPLFHVEEQLVD